MTRMGKVLLAVLVLMLTCFLVIGAGSSEVKADSPFREIKIKVNLHNGHIKEFCLVPLDPTKECKKMDRVPGEPELTLRQTILHYSGSNCIVMVIGGHPYQVCW